MEARQIAVTGGCYDRDWRQTQFQYAESYMRYASKECKNTYYIQTLEDLHV